MKVTAWQWDGNEVVGIFWFGVVPLLSVPHRWGNEQKTYTESRLLLRPGKSVIIGIIGIIEIIEIMEIIGIIGIVGHFLTS